MNLAAALLLSLTASTAAADDLDEDPSREGLQLGEWTLSPSVAVRVRGEYRRNPVDLGGDTFAWSAVQGDGFRSAAPDVTGRLPSVRDSATVSERARLGLGAQNGKLRGQVTLQDARLLGSLPGGVGAPTFGMATFSPYEAWLDVRTDETEPMLEARLGRQVVAWGEGRLLGARDWWQGGATLDAARLQFHFGGGLTDLEVLAALLAAPGHPTPPQATNDAANRGGTGAQLYGLRSAWHLGPLLHVEASALARVARDPLPPELARGDTATADLHLFGAYRGVSYSVEGAYQLGRVASYDVNRKVGALAAAGRVDWQTALPLELRLGLAGAYASGDGSNGRGSDLRRFDPILPDVHRHHGMMDLVAWSNLIEGAGSVGARPHAMLDASVRYAVLGLADPRDRWSTSNMLPVGADPANTSRLLGHEVDVRIAFEPRKDVIVDAGYGVLVTGAGARAVLSAAGRGSPDLLQFGYLQAGFRAP